MVQKETPSSSSRDPISPLPPPPPGAESPTQRRLEILRRAAEVFRAKGYHAAGMREIAEGLGLAPGALYYYFRSKDDLLHACQEIALDRLVAGARAVVAAPTRPEVRLRDLVRLHLGLVLDELGGSAVHLEFGALPPERLADVVERRDRYEALWRGLIEEGVREGAFRSVDPKMTAMALLGALNGTVVWWRPEGPASSREVADTYATLFLQGLDADPVARRRSDDEETTG